MTVTPGGYTPVSSVSVTPSVDRTVSRTLIVLPGQVWRSELEAEFIRLGMPEDRAPISAGRVLSRICKHAGYLNCFRYDEADQADVSEVGGTEHRAKSRAGAE